ADAREDLAHAHPARARLLGQAVLVRVPVELEPYATDLYSGRAAYVDLRALRRGLVGDECRLRPQDPRPRRDPRRPVARPGDAAPLAPPRARERYQVRLPLRRPGQVAADAVLLPARVETRHQVLPVVARVWVLQLEHAPRGEHPAAPL